MDSKKFHELIQEREKTIFLIRQLSIESGKKLTDEDIDKIRVELFKNDMTIELANRQKERD